MQINFCFASILVCSNSDSSSLVHCWEHQCCLLWMGNHQLLRLWSKGMAPGALLCHPTSNPLRLHLCSGKPHQYLHKLNIHRTILWHWSQLSWNSPCPSDWTLTIPKGRGWCYVMPFISVSSNRSLIRLPSSYTQRHVVLITSGYSLASTIPFLLWKKAAVLSGWTPCVGSKVCQADPYVLATSGTSISLALWHLHPQRREDFNQHPQNCI